MSLFVFNIFIFIWHIDFKHFGYYGTYFLSIKDMKKPEFSVYKHSGGMATSYPEIIYYYNFIERVVSRCVNKSK